MVKKSELKKCSVFKSFSDKQVERLARITEKVICKADSHFYRQGDWANYLFVLSKGTVKLRGPETGDETEVAVEIRKSGEVFGVACFMTPQEHTMTGVCLEDSEVLAIDADELLELRKADAEMDHRLMKTVALPHLERRMAARRQLHGKATLQEIATAPQVRDKGRTARNPGRG